MLALSNLLTEQRTQMKQISIATQLNRAIHFAGRLQKDIAHQSDITEATLSRFLSEKTDIKLTTFTAILACLKIDLAAVLHKEINKASGLQEDSESTDVDRLLELLPKNKRRNAIEHLLALSKGTKSYEVSKIRKKMEETLNK